MTTAKQTTAQQTGSQQTATEQTGTEEAGTQQAGTYDAGTDETGMPQTGTDETGMPQTSEFMPITRGADGVLRPVWADRTVAAREYFDTEWGGPVTTERGIFEVLALLVFAGGLTWAAVLAKREALRAAFAGFDPDAVAAFDDEDVRRLLDDVYMIRNTRKIMAIVQNARATCDLRARGGLPALVWWGAPGETIGAPVELDRVPRSDTRSASLADTLRGAGFTHVGPVAAQSLLVATGAVPVTRPRTTPVAAPTADWTDARYAV